MVSAGLRACVPQRPYCKASAFLSLQEWQGPPGQTHWRQPQLFPRGTTGAAWQVLARKQERPCDCGSVQGVVNCGACRERYVRGAGRSDGHAGIAGWPGGWCAGHAGSGAKSAVRQRVANCARAQCPHRGETVRQHLPREREKEEGRRLQVLPHTLRLLPRKGPRISLRRRQRGRYCFSFSEAFCGLG